jgi:hypothetical protein
MPVWLTAAQNFSLSVSLFVWFLSHCGWHRFRLEMMPAILLALDQLNSKAMEIGNIIISTAVGTGFVLFVAAVLVGLFVRRK